MYAPGLILRILFLGLYALLIAPLNAGNIPVEEVPTNLHGRPVTGFRLLIPREPQSIQAKVIEHVSLYASKPFLFSNQVAFEQVLYPPIIDSRQISLYYITEKGSGGTIMTVVAMYDLKRSINSRDYPDLALRLVIDLAYLVRKLSGGTIEFSGTVFDDLTLNQYASIYKTVQEIKKDQFVTLPKQEETQVNTVFIEKNPFQQYQPSQLDSISNIILEQSKLLQLKQQSLALEIAQFQKEKTDWEQQFEFYSNQQFDTKKLKDSINTLNKKISKMLVVNYSGDGEKKPAKTGALVDTIIALRSKLTSARINTARLEYETDSLSLEIKKLRITPVIPDKPDPTANQQLIQKLQSENLQLQISNAELLQKLDGLHANQETSSMPMYKDRDSLLGIIALLSKEQQNLNKQSGKVSDLQQKIKLLEDSVLWYRQHSVETTTTPDPKIKDLEQQLAFVNQQNKELTANLVESVNALKELKLHSEEMLSKIENYQGQVTTMQLELQSLKKKNTDLQGGMVHKDTIVAWNLRLLTTKKEASMAKGQQELLLKRVDSLAYIIKQLEKQRNEYQLQLSKRDKLLDSLNSNKKPISTQEQFLYEKQLKLQQLELQLKSKESGLNDKEKLLIQRETTLNNRKVQLDARELKYKGLEDKENMLKLTEVKLKQGAPDVTKWLQEWQTTYQKTTTKTDPDITFGASGAGKMNISGKEINNLQFTCSLMDLEALTRITCSLARNATFGTAVPGGIDVSHIMLATVHPEPLDLFVRILSTTGGCMVNIAARTLSGNWIDLATDAGKSAALKTFAETLLRAYP